MTIKVYSFVYCNLTCLGKQLRINDFDRNYIDNGFTPMI